MTRTKISTNAVTGSVTLDYLDTDRNERRTRTFTTTMTEGTGYVIEVTPDGTYPQVCAKLAHGGYTLMAYRETLADVIRREYRAMRAADKRREGWAE